MISQKELDEFRRLATIHETFTGYTVIKLVNEIERLSKATEEKQNTIPSVSELLLKLGKELKEAKEYIVATDRKYDLAMNHISSTYTIINKVLNRWNKFKLLYKTGPNSSEEACDYYDCLDKLNRTYTIAHDEFNQKFSDLIIKQT